MRTPHSRRIYDYRIRQTFCETGDRDLFPELNIPRSTVRSWILRGVPDVVTNDLTSLDRSDLLVEIQELQRRMALLGAVVGLLTDSWALEDRLGSGATCRVLHEAASQIRTDSGAPTVFADSVSENVNREVDELLERVDLRRVLAQVEVTFSNSMIEAFWRSLKHSWIYLHSLNTFAALRRLVDFYVSGRAIRGRCSRNGHGPECHETQLGFEYSVRLTD